MDEKRYTSDGDIEKDAEVKAYSETSDTNHNAPLKRQLKNRHIAMIRYGLFNIIAFNNWPVI